MKCGLSILLMLYSLLVCAQDSLSYPAVAPQSHAGRSYSKDKVDLKPQLHEVRQEQIEKRVETG